MDIVWSHYNVCPPAVKRIIWERRELESEHPEYKVFFDDRAPMTFIAFIIGPDDSIYQHKLLKFRIDIPLNYPNVSQATRPSQANPAQQQRETYHGCVERNRRR